MSLFGVNLFGWAADELKANKPAVIAALAPANLWVEGETLKLTDQAASIISSHDPVLKGTVELAIGVVKAKVQAFEATELPVLEGDGVDQLVALFQHASEPAVAKPAFEGAEKAQ